MNPLQLRRQHRLSHLSLAALVSLLPLALIVPSLLWQERADQYRQTVRQTDMAQQRLDTILDQAERASLAILPYAGRPCGEASYPLRHQAAVVPFVRTAALIRDDVIYCSSLEGALSMPLPKREFIDGRLQLLPGNVVTPKIPLLLYRRDGAHVGALAVIDGQYLQMALQDASVSGPLYLQVGDIWLGPQQQVGQGRPPQSGRVVLKRPSARYPYTVWTSYNQLPWQDMLWQRHALQTLLLSALGLLAGFTLYWLLGRPVSPSMELRRALADDEFEAYLQPVVRPMQAGWTGAEVLMRWRHPRGGLIRPDLFIPSAEESGVIVPMTRQLMRTVVEQLCQAPLPPGFRLGFNISRAQLHDLRLFDDCRELQQQLAAQGAGLALELTEREPIEITPAIERLFRDLHQLGVKILLDDFGTGHSSLAYLHRLAVDGLKIDQSFVARIGGDVLSTHIVDSVVELARKLELQTVAEGVETREQAAYLTGLGVNGLQGYLIARPMPLSEFVRRLREDDSWTP
ncbi:EAL domain-containing protein [Chromobacterium sp. IIBBL 290-4]|uniref:EAL domain-containing protein n=1 Tax=Chromobacterium sp. IIBBL 290-4 TaxID=2953890 RepID=UPI0020B87D48|nr:EAL domain-containing protein [Chromobacterium sp. IIBBL 290-4]UTH75702.1 EAL domain-containing protein [Chromobacterium sp. IIBBL 290-4]